MRVHFPALASQPLPTAQRSSKPFTALVDQRAFTLVEILIAIGLLGLVLTAIFSSWTAILRATKVGQDAAASVQRSRIAVRTIEDALLGVQSFAANQKYYAFYSESGSDGRFSFVSRLPQSFPRSGRFGDLDVRRVEFSLQAGTEGTDLVLRQKPLLMGEDFMDWDEDEKNYPLVLAKFVTDFQVEFYDKDKKEWVDEWLEAKTNQLPQLVRFSMKLADNAHSSQREEVTRIVNLPAQTVRREWQTAIPRTPQDQFRDRTNQPINPNQPPINQQQPPLRNQFR